MSMTESSGKAPQNLGSTPQPTPAAEATKVKRSPSVGTWVVFDSQGAAHSTYSGEVSALRAATLIGGKVQWVEHGQRLAAK